MNGNLIAHPRNFGLLLAAAALPTAAAFAQDAQPVTPPAATPAPATAGAPAPAPTASPSISFAPRAPVVQAVPLLPQASEPEAASPAAATAAPVRRASRVPAPAARAARPVPQAPPGPVATAVTPASVPAASPSPEASATSPEPAVTPALEAATAPAPAPANNQQMSSGAAWAMLAIPVLAIIGLIAFLLGRRRRSAETVYDEPYYAPVEEAPVAAAPVAYVEEPVTHIEEPTTLAPVALVDEGDAAGRPWIDIGLRPIRAEDSLQVELTVSNSGDAEARDVRVSTWMLNGASSSDGEQGLIDARSTAQVATVDVAPGDNKSVDTTLALPDATGTPMLVAEARYPLPGGGEGRIAATFEIDVNAESENVEARLHELLERA